jgi:hypothetical protein
MPKDHLLVDWFPQGEHTPADEIEQVRADWFAEDFCQDCEEVAKSSGGSYLESRPLAGAYLLKLGDMEYVMCLMHIQEDDFLEVCP